MTRFKKHKKHLLSTFFCLSLLLNALAQNNDTPQQILPFSDTKPLYTKESTFGLMLHTSGWGLNYRSGKNKTGTRRQILALEIATYKHPKERRSSVSEGSGRYKYGKINTPVFLRGSFGYQQVIYNKQVSNSIQIRYLILGGPSIIFGKPYFVNVKTNNADSRIFTQKQFNETLTRDSIYDGRSPWLVGLNKTIPYPAIHLKAAISFEYAGYSEDIKALEFGATLDFLPIPIKVYAFESRKPLFLQLYMSFNFGSQWY